MRLIATLIADPRAANLTPELAQTAAAWLAPGEDAPEVDWLAPGVACDIPVGNMGADVALRRAHHALGAAPVDCVVQTEAGRRKQLLVADMESTMIVNEMVDDLAEYLNIRDQVAAITARAMAGELPFREALRDRVALLGGLEEEVLLRARERIRFMPGALALVHTMAHHGARTALVTGGFQVFAEWVQVRAGFDHLYANILKIEGGIVTGEVGEPIIGRFGKRDAMLALSEQYGLDIAAVMAVGDGANDVEMLRHAGAGVAFRAKPAVRALAPFRIDHGDLTALLYMQGYRREEFVTEALPTPKAGPGVESKAA